jgi:hypothetical protein
VSRAALRRIVVSAAAATAVGATVVYAPTASRASGGKPSAVTFLSGVVRLLAANRYQTAWMSLHPDDQRLVSRELYARCESLDPIPGRLTRLRAVSVSDDRVVVAPHSPVANAVSVVFEARIVGALPRENARVVITAHAIDVAGRWRWILPQSRLHQYFEPPCS